MLEMVQDLQFGSYVNSSGQNSSNPSGLGLELTHEARVGLDLDVSEVMSSEGRRGLRD